MNAPIDAYKDLEQVPMEQTAYLLAESSNSAALSKIRAYLNKWRPMRSGLSLVGNELAALGMERGQKFDSIVEQVFAIQLTGRGKTPEEREKILRKLSGIKEAPKKKETPKKAGKAAGGKTEPAVPEAGAKPAVGAAGAKVVHKPQSKSAARGCGDRIVSKHGAKAAAHSGRAGRRAAGESSAGYFPAGVRELGSRFEVRRSAKGAKAGLRHFRNGEIFGSGGLWETS